MVRSIDCSGQLAKGCHLEQFNRCRDQHDMPSCRSMHDLMPKTRPRRHLSAPSEEYCKLLATKG